MAEKTFEPDFDWSVFEKLGAANLRPQDALNELIANSIDSWIEKFTNSNRPKLKIDIEYERDDGVITIIDNAFGLSMDELIKTTTLGKSDKDKSDERLMGTFGFGLTVATSSMGGHYEMYSLKRGANNDKVSKIVFPTKKLAEENTTSRPTSNTLAKSQTPLKNLKHGTAVVISELKKELPNRAALSKHFGYSWKYFLTDENNFGKKVEINFIEGENQKKSIEPLGIEDFVEKASIIDIEIPVSWSENEEPDAFITGKVGWAKTGGTQDSSSGGINIYRKGQLIRLLDKSTDREEMWYTWHPSVSRFYAEINVDFISSNPEKDYLDTTTVEFQAAQLAFQTKMAPALKFVKFKNKNINTNVGMLKTLAKWKELFGKELTAEEKALISGGGETGGGETGGGETGGGETGGGETGGGEAGGGETGGGETGGGETGGGETGEFNIINKDEFQFNQKKYKIRIRSLEGSQSSLWSQYYDETDKTWTIFINEKTGSEKLDKSISKIKNVSNSEFHKLSRALIIRDSLRSLLEYEGLSQTQSESFADDWLKEFYKQ